MRSGTAPPLASLDGGPIPSVESSLCLDNGDQRDPSIAAGKRTAPPPSEAPLENPTFAATSASSPLVAESPYSTSHHRNDIPALADQDQNVYFAAGGGGTNGTFSAYESVTQQIYDYHQQPGV